MEKDSKKLQELQMLEQNLQNLFFQKQAFQMELSETLSALKEIENSSGDVFKIIGQLMIKKDKSEIKKDLEEKKKVLELRIKSIEKQEETFTSKVRTLREELIKSK